LRKNSKDKEICKKTNLAILTQRRVSDIISSATERMSKVGEPDFIELTNVDLQDLKTNKVIEGLRSVVVNKSAISIIIPGDVAQMEDDS